MNELCNMQPLREYCRQKKYPKLSQWNHWIFSRHPIALKCIKKLGGRYLVNLDAWSEVVRNATINGEQGL